MKNERKFPEHGTLVWKWQPPPTANNGIGRLLHIHFDVCSIMSSADSSNLQLPKQSEGKGICYYPDYLHLNEILSAQQPRSAQSSAVATSDGKPAHDEMLFIIIHQTYELW